MWAGFFILLQFGFEWYFLPVLDTHTICSLLLTAAVLCEVSCAGCVAAAVSLFDLVFDEELPEVFVCTVPEMTNAPFASTVFPSGVVVLVRQ